MAITSTIDNRRVVSAEKRPARRGRLLGPDRLWALAFVTPYIVVFLAFVIYPICYGLWLGSDPASYRQLFADPVYPSALLNTLIYLLVAVNLKLFLALLLSGFFMRKGWWTKTLLLIFILPWAVPAIPSYISIHWMLNSQWGLVNNMIWSLFQVDGPPWLDNVDPGAGLGDLRPYLEVDAVLDHHFPGRDAWRSRQSSMRPPRSMAPAGSTCSGTSPSPCSPVSIWFAHCSARYGRSATSMPYASSLVVAPPFPPMSWRRLAFAMHSRSAIPRWAWPRCCPPCRVLIPLVVILMRQLKKGQVQL